MTVLLSTDLHFSDKAKDSYRFGIFDFLLRQRAKHKASLIVILGDITDEKDNHSSLLVNAVVEGFTKLAKECPVIIMMGNHDYLADPTNPFFKFLNEMKNIKFVTKPATWITSKESKLLFLPHFKSEEEWDSFKLDKRPDYVFIHQTVTGAISESGRRLDGFSLKPLKRLKARLVFGGDVHKPHTIEPVIYVGPPYHVRFGDNFTPRCIVLNEEDATYKDIHFKCPRKWSLKIRDIQEIEFNHQLRAGDQVKVELELTREEVVEWPVYKDRLVKLLADLGLEVYGVSLKVTKTGPRRKEEKDEVTPLKQRAPMEVLGSFAKREKLPRTVRETGLKLLDG